MSIRYWKLKIAVRSAGLLNAVHKRYTRFTVQAVLSVTNLDRSSPRVSSM